MSKELEILKIQNGKRIGRILQVQDVGDITQPSTVQKIERLVANAFNKDYTGGLAKFCEVAVNLGLLERIGAKKPMYRISPLGTTVVGQLRAEAMKENSLWQDYVRKSNSPNVTPPSAAQNTSGHTFQPA